MKILDELVEEERISPLERAFALYGLDGHGGEAEALFLSHLLFSARAGHLCVTPGGAPDPRASWLLGHAEAEAISAQVWVGASKLPQKLVASGTADESSPVYRLGDRFYLRRHWVAETKVVESVRALAGDGVESDVGAVTAEVEKLVGLLPEQGEAILGAARWRLSLIAGGPGTGKTYTAARLIHCLRETLGLTIALAAPTGKAAGNLERALRGLIAEPPAVQTLHALLGMRGAGQPRRKGVRLAADLVLVDEAAMIDVGLMANLLAAIKPGGRLVLLGDGAQLPAVEAGGIFRDLVEAPALRSHTTHLGRCMRTEEKGLLDLAASVRQGGSLEGVKRLSWVEGSPYAMQKEIVREAARRYRKGTDQFRLLGATRKGPLGVDALNRATFEELSSSFRPGEAMAVPIVITRNDYRLGLFNGDCGTLFCHSRGARDPRDYAVFPSLGAPLTVFALPEWEYAYALSVHKSQGSEFSSVLLVVPRSGEIFGRELIYTALTRAKREFLLCAPAGLVEEMIARTTIRCSGIRERL